MKNKGKKIGMVLMTGVICITLLGGCASSKNNALQGDSNDSWEKKNNGNKGNIENEENIGNIGGDTSETKSDGKSVGNFNTQDINGKAYTKDIFKEYDLTLVNVFATWCSPCVAEMPDLDKLYRRMKDKGVNVVGIILDDILDENGDIDEEGLERAKLLAKKTGVTYPILLPDATYMNGRLMSIEALPETFFVDKNGNLVGEAYSGSGDFEDWLEVVEQELANLKEGN